jgi:cytosine/adenosine deaminase-related metal-dependent hydrolase
MDARLDVEGKAEKVLAELLESGMGTKQAARIVADMTGISTRRAYALALRAKERDRS